ncbi:MAG: type II toxin-antitoxin system PemK/MazF family toxin [Bryobacterales bacterium]|nr:type II toxin-antitoxin system PemK/MazF family toxin [Bryobacterales bacterium]
MEEVAAEERGSRLFVLTCKRRFIICFRQGDAESEFVFGRRRASGGPQFGLYAPQTAWPSHPGAKVSEISAKNSCDLVIVDRGVNGDRPKGPPRPEREYLIKLSWHMPKMASNAQVTRGPYPLAAVQTPSQKESPRRWKPSGNCGIPRSRKAWVEIAGKMRRGAIHGCDLEPRSGQEQGERRPVVIVSADLYNASRSLLIGIVPLTRSPAKTLLHVALTPEDTGLEAPSTALEDHARFIDRSHLRPDAAGRLFTEGAELDRPESRPRGGAASGRFVEGLPANPRNVRRDWKRSATNPQVTPGPRAQAACDPRNRPLCV